MSNFQSLKKSSADMSRLTKELEKMNQFGERQADDRYWKPTLDKAGNGFAVIRFLPGPAVDGEDSLPWVRLFSHGFKSSSGKWYIENSLTTLGQTDPVGELNTALWNSTEDKDAPARKQASAQKRRLNYISNILVISDPKNPENDGKVFLFRYGKKIFDKISEAMHPPYDDSGRAPDHPQYNPTNAFSPFNLWTGANFKLTVKSIPAPGGGSYPNYDSSTWATPAPIAGDDEFLEKLWKSEYSLKEIIDAKNFKSYDELKKRLTEVLGSSSLTPNGARAENKKLDVADDTPSFDSAKKSKSVEDSPPWGEEDDDTLASFRSLAE